MDDPLGKKGIQKAYGADFFQRFAALSRQRLEEMLPHVPDIGDSIFAFNYLYGPCYFAWYQALRDLNIDETTALNLIWPINGGLVKSIPGPLLRWFGKQMYRANSAEEPSMPKNAVRPASFTHSIGASSMLISMPIPSSSTSMNVGC